MSRPQSCETTNNKHITRVDKSPVPILPVKEAYNRGLISRQQMKTISGQAKSGDHDGAKKGIEKLTKGVALYELN